MQTIGPAPLRAYRDGTVTTGRPGSPFTFYGKVVFDRARSKRAVCLSIVVLAIGGTV